MLLVDGVKQFTLTPDALPFLKASWLPKIKIEPCSVPELVGPCWLWLGAHSGDGYGIVRVGGAKVSGGRLWRLHRWMIHSHSGPIPDGYEPHHRCYQRNCFQPYHLQVISKADNVAESNARRGILPPVELSPEDIHALIYG